MIDSTTLDERETTPNAARLNVIEWATVKHVTIVNLVLLVQRQQKLDLKHRVQLVLPDVKQKQKEVFDAKFVRKVGR